MKGARPMTFGYGWFSSTITITCRILGRLWGVRPHACGARRWGVAAVPARPVGRGRRRRERRGADRDERDAARHADAAPTSAVQYAQRRAASGISLRHSGQSRVVGAGSSLARRAAIAFTGFTTKKKTAAAMSTNEISAFKKAP